MSTTIDIRTNQGPVTAIRIADKSTTFYIADIVERYAAGGITLKDSHENRTLRIRDREHADNLRKALAEAERLGWL